MKWPWTIYVARAAPAPQFGPARSYPPLSRWHGTAWRQHAYARVIRLDGEFQTLRVSPTNYWAIAPARDHLSLAEEYIRRRPNPVASWTGSFIEGAWVHIHAAEVALIELSPAAASTARIQLILAEASDHLPKDDRRLATLEQLATKANPSGSDRDWIAGYMESVYQTTDGAHVRVRSFRNILLIATLVLTILAAGCAVIGSLAPTQFELRSTATGEVAVDTVSTDDPDRVATQDGTPDEAPGVLPDVVVAELMGLLGASLSGALAIRNMRGTATGYAVPMASLLLKLPLGALIAVAGLWFIQAGMLLDVEVSSAAELVAYALLFGAAQQLFTKVIDTQTQRVLDAVPPREGAGAESEAREKS